MDDDDDYKSPVNTPDKIIKYMEDHPYIFFTFFIILPVILIALLFT